LADEHFASALDGIDIVKQAAGNVLSLRGLSVKQRRMISYRARQDWA
jgi:hypothetical protein